MRALFRIFGLSIEPVGLNFVIGSRFKHRVSRCDMSQSVRYSAVFRRFGSQVSDMILGYRSQDFGSIISLQYTK